MKSSFYKSLGLRTGFPRGANYAGPVTVFKPNGDGVLAPVPPAALEARAEPAVVTHRELNTSLSRWHAARKQQG